MDLAVLIILIIVVLLFFKNFKSIVYLLGIIDIFLRILNFIKNNLSIKEVTNFITKYFPSSIPDLIDSYSNGILFTIIMWVYVALMGIFLYYLIKYLFTNRH